MKRFVGIFLTACILTTVFAGCNSISDDGNSSNAGDDTASTASVDEALVSQQFAELDKTELNVTEVADALKNGIEFTDELSEVPLEMALSRYGLTAEQVTEGKVYQSGGATAEEIVVLKVADGQMDSVMGQIFVYVDNRKADFQDYNPEELDKLESPVLYQPGNYLILCLSNDNDKAEEIIEGFINA